MQGNLHVRFGERDEETRHRKVRERFIPTLHLHFKSHVGTTYKRALTRKIPGRDREVPHRPDRLAASGKAPLYDGRITTKGDATCANPAISIRN